MPNSMVPGLRTFSVTAARDGDLFEQDFHAGGECGAMVSALMAINKAWRTDYRTWDDMACDSDAVQIIEHPAFMADRIPLSLLEWLVGMADEAITVRQNDEEDETDPATMESYRDSLAEARAALDGQEGGK